MRISDWSSDVCSSDLTNQFKRSGARGHACRDRNRAPFKLGRGGGTQIRRVTGGPARLWRGKGRRHIRGLSQPQGDAARRAALHPLPDRPLRRSEEHTSELQSLMRLSFSVFCLKKKTKQKKPHNNNT